MSIKSAFEKAGYKDSREEWPSDDLLQIAVKAMVRHADNMDATQHAIFRACRTDAALLRQLILPWWRQATASLITAARQDISRRERDGSLQTSLERKASAVISLENARELRREAKEREEELAAIGERDREYREYLKQWTATKAREFTIDDTPFWEVATRRARAWQRRSAREAKFVDLLLAGVPEDDRPISYYRRPDEINDIWDKAFST